MAALVAPQQETEDHRGGLQSDPGSTRPQAEDDFEIPVWIRDKMIQRVFELEPHTSQAAAEEHVDSALAKLKRLYRELGLLPGSAREAEQAPAGFRAEEDEDGGGLVELGINPNDLAYQVADALHGTTGIGDGLQEDYPFACVCDLTGTCKSDPAKTKCSARAGQDENSAPGSSFIAFWAAAASVVAVVTPLFGQSG
jgi:hypothetical protein